MVGKCSERQANIVSHLTKDSSPAVRASALHVFEDAIHMQSMPSIVFSPSKIHFAKSMRHCYELKEDAFFLPRLVPENQVMCDYLCDLSRCKWAAFENLSISSMFWCTRHDSNMRPPDS
jgi:hypothetical protein